MTNVHLETPYLQSPGAAWLKGNLHTHTLRTDGKSEPQEMIAAYADLGYDFLMLSDHDVFSDGAGLDPLGMVLLNGNEISSNGTHVLDVGAKTRVEPSFDRQAVIDAVNKDSGFPILCHPNWTENFNHYTYEKLLQLTGYAGIEIFNGVVMDLPGSHLALDKWDRLLAAGRRVWGYANDDAHRKEQVGRGWNVVRAKARTKKAILDALRAGSFYASSGVVIEEIASDEAMLVVHAPNADAISVFAPYGARIYTSHGPHMCYDLSSLMAPFVRVECCGRAGTSAWTQPVLIRGGKYEALQKRFAELAGAAKPTLHALHSAHAPKLTGKIDDPAWLKAESSNAFLRMGDGEKPEVKTEVRVVATEWKLFVAVRCEEPRLEAMRLRAKADNDPATWSDDSVEVFLDVKDSKQEYHQIAVNAAGFVFGATSNSGKPLADKVQAKTGRYEGGWTMEFAVPLEALGASSAPGTRWGFHVCRNRTVAKRHYVWSWVGTTNHAPERFGELVF